VRIIYQGGYEEFIIESGINDKIDFNIGGSELTATLTAGTYGSGTLMCAQIVSAFEAAEDTGIYSATYSPLTAKFTITKSTGTFQIKWSTGSHASQGAGATLGFSADDTGSLTYTSDNEVLGIPDNIQHACNMLVAHLYNQSKKGMGYVDQESFNIGNQSFRPSQKAVPNNVLEIISQYRNINI
jgi:hypothetical protein